MRAAHSFCRLYSGRCIASCHDTADCIPCASAVMLANRRSHCLFPQHLAVWSLFPLPHHIPRPRPVGRAPACPYAHRSRRCSLCGASSARRCRRSHSPLADAGESPRGSAGLYIRSSASSSFHRTHFRFCCKESTIRNCNHISCFRCGILILILTKCAGSKSVHVPVCPRLLFHRLVPMLTMTVHTLRRVYFHSNYDLSFPVMPIM